MEATGRCLVVVVGGDCFDELSNRFLLFLFEVHATPASAQSVRIAGGLTPQTVEVEPILEVEFSLQPQRQLAIPLFVRHYIHFHFDVTSCRFRHVSVNWKELGRGGALNKSI